MDTQQKQLLLIDLCARLPYNVMVDYDSHIYVLNEIDPSCKDIDYITVRIQDVERLTYAKSKMIENIKPYLRPMSNVSEMWGGLTEEEIENPWILFDSPVDALDYFLTNHIDFRGLIEKGLALEAPEEMYKTE